MSPGNGRAAQATDTWAGAVISATAVTTAAYLNMQCCSLYDENHESQDGGVHHQQEMWDHVG